MCSAGREENPKGSNYTDVMTVKMPDEKIPAVSDDKSVYTTVDHVKTEKVRLNGVLVHISAPGLLSNTSPPKHCSAIKSTLDSVQRGWFYHTVN